MTEDMGTCTKEDQEKEIIAAIEDLRELTSKILAQCSGNPGTHIMISLFTAVRHIYSNFLEVGMLSSHPDRGNIIKRIEDLAKEFTGATPEFLDLLWEFLDKCWRDVAVIKSPDDFVVTKGNPEVIN